MRCRKREREKRCERKKPRSAPAPSQRRQDLKRPKFVFSYFRQQRRYHSLESDHPHILTAHRVWPCSGDCLINYRTVSLGDLNMPHYICGGYFFSGGYASRQIQMLSICLYYFVGKANSTNEKSCDLLPRELSLTADAK
jgi:hypothetical protein